MYREVPRINTIIEKKVRNKENELLAKKLVEVKPTINKYSTEYKLPHLENRLKKNLLIEERST